MVQVKYGNDSEEIKDCIDGMKKSIESLEAKGRDIVRKGDMLAFELYQDKISSWNRALGEMQSWTG